jgi:hypothetical protein
MENTFPNIIMQDSFKSSLINLHAKILNQNDEFMLCKCRYGHKFKVTKKTYNTIIFIDKDDWCIECKNPDFINKLLVNINNELYEIDSNLQVYKIDLYGNCNATCKKNHIMSFDIDDIPYNCIQCMSIHNSTNNLLKTPSISKNSLSDKFQSNELSDCEDTNYENTGYEETGYEDTGYEETGYEDTGYEDDEYGDGNDFLQLYEDSDQNNEESEMSDNMNFDEKFGYIDFDDMNHDHSYCIDESVLDNIIKLVDSYDIKYHDFNNIQRSNNLINLYNINDLNILLKF